MLRPIDSIGSPKVIPKFFEKYILRYLLNWVVWLLIERELIRGLDKKPSVGNTLMGTDFPLYFCGLNFFDPSVEGW